MERLGGSEVWAIAIVGGNDEMGYWTLFGFLTVYESTYLGRLLENWEGPATGVFPAIKNDANSRLQTAGLESSNVFAPLRRSGFWWGTGRNEGLL